MKTLRYPFALTLSLLIAQSGRCDERAALAEEIVSAQEAPGRTFHPEFRQRAEKRLLESPFGELKTAAENLAIMPLDLGDSTNDLVYTRFAQPCRIIDTRLAGGLLTSNRDFKVAGTGGFESQGGTPGGCGIPMGPATAVMINFVAVNPSGAGNLRGAAWPNAVPTVGSIINYQALTPGLNIANGVIFPICDSSTAACSTGSDITLFPNGAGVHVVADVLGYFSSFPLTPAGTGIPRTQSDLLYSTLEKPCRVVDTRVGGGLLSPGAPYNFKVAGDGDMTSQGGPAFGCSVPDGATVAMLNIVAVNPSGAGNLRGSAFPNAVPAIGSIINYQLLSPNLNIANGVLFPVCDPAEDTCTSDIRLQAVSSGVHVVIDVLGWYARFLPGATGPPATQRNLTYTTFQQPCRIIDTRAPGAGGRLIVDPRNFKVKGKTGFDSQGGNSDGCGIPDDATVAMINFVAVNPLGAGNLRGSAFPQEIPTFGSIINYQLLSPALNLANGLLFPICDGDELACPSDITLEANGAGVHVVADVTGFARRVPNLPPDDIQLSNASLNENVGVGSFVGFLSSLDPDPADVHTYTLVAGAGSDDNASFQIVGNQLNSNATFNFESKSSYTIRVRSTDGGALFLEEALTITIVNVNEAPIADIDTYNSIGNTQIHGGFGISIPGVADYGFTFGALDAPTGDFDPDFGYPPFSTLSIVPASGPTSKGGSYSIQADGRFTYVPPLGITTAAGDPDTFDYTLTDGTFTDIGTVRINLTNLVYYVHPVVDGTNNPAGGDGRSNNAFDTLAAAQAGSTPNSVIFVFAGNTATTPMTSGISLKNGQKLWGEAYGLQFPGFFPIVSPGATQPRVNNAGGNAVTILANTANLTGLEIRGLDLQGNPNAIEITTLNTFNAEVQIRANTIRGAVAEGIEVNQDSSGSSTIALSDLTVTAAGNGIDLQRTAGSLYITSLSNLTISGDTGGTGINVVNGIFDAVPGGGPNTVSGGTAIQVGAPSNGVGAGGIILTNASGHVLFGDLDIFADNGPGLQASGAGLPFSGNELQLIMAPAGPPFGGGHSVVSATSGAAVDLNLVSGTLRFAQVNSINSVGRGVSLVSFGSSSGSSNFSGGAGSSIENASLTDFFVDGGHAQIDFAGPITDDTGQLVNITNTIGGNKTFTGAISDGGDGDGSGINITNNSGNLFEIVFSGGISLSTGPNNAFNAASAEWFSSSAIEITGSANTIATTTGVPLSVSNQYIGDAGLTFRSINSNGATSGVILNNTYGPFTITGNGGSCTSAATCTGGAIQSSTGPGMSITSTFPVSLTNVNVEGGGDDGIVGTSVGDLSITTSRVVNNGNAVTERGVDLTNVYGTSAVTGSLFSGNAGDNFYVSNNASTLSLNVTGSTFSNTSPAFGNDGIHLFGQDTAEMIVSVTGSAFTHNRGDHFHAAADGAIFTPNMNITFQNNSLTGDRGVSYGGTDVGAGMNISAARNSQLTFNISNNGTAGAPIVGAVAPAINIDLAASSTASSVLAGTISNNFIGAAATVDSGSQTDGISVVSRGSGTTRVAITNNTIRQYRNTGLLLRKQEGNGNLHLTVTGNTVANPGAFATNGLFLLSGSIAGDSGLTCANLGSGGANTIAGSAPVGGTDFRLRQRFATTVRLPGYGGPAGDTAAVVAFVQGLNAGVESGSATADFPASGGGFVSGAACTAP